MTDLGLFQSFNDEWKAARMARRVLSIFVAFGFCLATASCGGGGDDDHGDGGHSTPRPLAATQLCGASGLPKDAASAVQYLTGKKEFARDDKGATPQRAADSLGGIYTPGKPTDWHNQVEKGRACIVNSFDGEMEELTTNVSIVSDSEPQKNAGGVGGAYRIGDNMAYSFHLGAYLYFPCVSDQLVGSADDKPLVRAELQNGVALLKQDPTAAEQAKVQQEQLVFLNAIAYAVSKDLDCVHSGLEPHAKLREVPSKPADRVSPASETPNW